MPTAAELLATFPFTRAKLDDNERRGWQLAVCSEGFDCCGYVTVLRIHYGDGSWSEPFVLWPASKFLRPAYAVENFLTTVKLAQALCETI